MSKIQASLSRGWNGPTALFTPFFSDMLKIRVFELKTKTGEKQPAKKVLRTVLLTGGGGCAKISL